MEFEKYGVEWNGDCWQSVFPTQQSEKSQLHTSIDDAVMYMREECGVTAPIVVYNHTED